MLTFPPFSQIQDSGSLRVNGHPLRATDNRWYAYQVLRKSRSNEWEVESTVRMVHENRGVLFRLKLENLQWSAQSAEITAVLTGLVGNYESAWDWTLPLPKDGDEFTTGRAGGGRILLVRHARSSGCVAFAFVQMPDRLELAGNRGLVTWKSR
jgi:hypothetical protein